MTEPCGTPNVTGTAADFLLSITTVRVRSDKNAWIHFRVGLLIVGKVFDKYHMYNELHVESHKFSIKMSAYYTKHGNENPALALLTSGLSKSTDVGI